MLCFAKHCYHLISDVRKSIFSLCKLHLYVSNLNLCAWSIEFYECDRVEFFITICIHIYVKLWIHIFHNATQINARARYSLSFEGTWPDLYLPQENDSIINAETSTEEEISLIPRLTRNKWTLYLPKAYHPLLLQQHRRNLQMAMKDLSNANAVCCTSHIFIILSHIYTQDFRKRT